MLLYFEEFHGPNRGTSSLMDQLRVSAPHVIEAAGLDARYSNTLLVHHRLQLSWNGNKEMNDRL